jgi:DNA-binding transcriptional MerR regulator
MPTSTTTRGLRVAELAAATGVGPDTIRYYEKSGLITPPERTASGYRIFPYAEVDRVRFIRDVQRLGVPLREIRDLLAVRDTGDCPCEPAADLLGRRIAEIDAELTRLSQLRAELGRMLTDLPTLDCADQGPVDWCPPTTSNDDVTEGGDCCG